MKKNPHLQQCTDPLTKYKECPIRKMTLLHDVPEDEPDWMQEFRESQYLLPARKILFRKDETARTLCPLFDGLLVLFKNLKNSRSQILRFLLPDDFFGFQVNGIRPAAGYMHGSQALMESTLCAFPITQFRPMMKKQPLLTKRLAEMEMHDMNLCRQHHHRADLEQPVHRQHTDHGIGVIGVEGCGGYYDQPASLREIILNYQLADALGTPIFIKKDTS